MNETSDARFIDHPIPSAGLMAIMIIAAIGFAIGIPLSFRTPHSEVPARMAPVLAAVLIFFIAILGFAFWLVCSAYDILDSKGITVKYGPSTNTYPWEDFLTVYWQKGLFTTKIGWASVTPCV